MGASEPDPADGQTVDPDVDGQTVDPDVDGQTVDPDVDGESEILDGQVVDGQVVDGQVVDGLPVLVAQAAEIQPAHWSARPTVQAAAAAATGFVAGAATLALMRRYGLRRVAREVEGVREAIDPRWRSPFGPSPGQTYVVHVRVVQPHQPE